MKSPHIILASRSPQRSSLLRQAGFPITIDPEDSSETIPSGALSMAEIAEKIAEEKARHYLDRRHALPAAGDLLLTADTIVTLDQHIMGKPSSPEEAEYFLRRLQGTTHRVYTGVHISPISEYGKNLISEACSFCDWTDVTMQPLCEQQIREYIKTDEWKEAAGGYRIQNAGIAFIDRIDGAYSTVVGLPIHRIYGIVWQNYH
ncbi:Maf family protein [Spirochaeta dissipatitropha]